jgi:propanediol dehydratase small subunit
MKITYEKQYTEQKFKHFTLYQNLSFSSTNVFWEYYNLIKDNSATTKEELMEIIKSYKKTAQSRLRINYNERGIEFFKEKKYIFPEFYIL